MRRRLVAIALVLGIVETIACSYIVELPASAPPIVPPDGSTEDAPDDGPSIPESDASPFEGAVPFCASRLPAPPLCVDFDDDPAPDLPSLGAIVQNGAELQLATTVALSPPRSLLAGTTGVGGDAFVTHPLGTSPERVALSSSVLLSAWTSAGATLLRIDLASADGGAATCSVRLVGGATWSIAQACEGVPEVVTDTGRPVETRTWRRLALSLALAPAKTVALDVDGVRVIEAPALDAMQPAPTSVGFGISAPDGTAVVFHDDVLVE